MMQRNDHDPRIESASYGVTTTTTTTPVLPPPSMTTTTTTTHNPTNTAFPSTSSSLSFFPERTHPDNPLHPQYQGGLHRRRGSAASDSSSTSTSPSSPKPPPPLPPPSRQSIDVLTFNPDHLSRQHHGRYQSVAGGNLGGTKYSSINNSNNDTYALHPNITHHHSNNSNNNSKKISGPVFQESAAVGGGGGGVAPSITHTKDNIHNMNISDSVHDVSDTLQPNAKHLCREESSDHPHAQTADSLVSLGGGGGVFGIDNGNEEDAEFEVRVIANRTDVTKDSDADDGHHEILHHRSNNDNDRILLPTSVIVAGTITSAPSLHDPGTGATAGAGGAGERGAMTQKRLQSLDILRGITIILMVLVNTQGADPFEQLAHTPWFGYTLADWVFPNFIFMVGMAVAIVLSPTKLITLSRPPPPPSHLQDQQQQQRGVRGVWKRHEIRIWMSLKIVKRSCILFAIGIALNALETIGRISSDSDTYWIRIPGVLQRIGFCYLVLALSVLWSPVRILGTVSSNQTTSTNQAMKDRARSTSPLSSAPPISSNRHTTPIPMTTTTTTTTVAQTTITSSRRVKILLPLLCTLLWFILTYTIQSSATKPIPSCLYPPSAISPSSSSSSNSSDITILPGYAPSRGQLSPSQCTAQSVLDTWLFTKDKDPNNPSFDAEGTLGTLMAIVTAWVGWMVGGWVVEQQRVWKGIAKELNEGYGREELQQQQQEVEGEEEGTEERVRRRRSRLVDESPKATSQSSSFHNQQQQPSPQTMETIHPPTTSHPTREETLQLRITLHQRAHLLSHLGEWFMVGTCTVFAGTILGWFLPICKALWTPSFTLYSAGVSINTLCILMYLYDVPSVAMSSSSISTPTASPTKSTHNYIFFTTLQNIAQRLLTKLQTIFSNTFSFATLILICYGRNPTLIYILSELAKIILEKIPAHGGFAWVQTVWSWLFFNSFYRILPAAWASLLFSLVYVLMFAPLLWVLNRRGIYLRV